MLHTLLDRLRLRKRAPVMLIVMAPALAYFALFGPKAPSDHAVVLRFPAPLAGISRVTTTWSATSGETEPLAGATFDVPSNANEFRTNVHIPDGEVWLDVELEATEGTRSIRRRIVLGDGETTVLLSVPPPGQ